MAKPSKVKCELVPDCNKDGFLVFTKDAEFSSPSAAAAVIHGGSANGLTAWKTESGKSLKQLDEQA